MQIGTFFVELTSDDLFLIFLRLSSSKVFTDFAINKI
jgi:hypothetical protein